MKRSKRIYILLGVLALACIATLSVMGYEEHREQIRNSDEIILEIPGDSVKALSWELDSESFSFRKEDTWIYEEDETFPADEEKIDALIEQFASFGVSFVIEEVEDYGLYGLDDPICRIRLETEEQSYEILLGNYSNMDSKRYVSIGDGNAYLVEEDPLEQFDTELRSLIRDDEIPYFETTTAIRFDGKETYAIVREENSRDAYCADDIYFTEQQGGKSPLDTSRVESYLSSIGSLGLTDYVTYHATEEELAAYGLDTPELTVTVDYTRENEDKEEEPGTFVLHVSREREERDLGAETENAAESGGENEDGSRNEDWDEEEITAYARVGESQIVYRITGEEYKALTAASYNDLRHQEVLTADFSDVTRIDISLEGNSYTFTSEEEEEDEERIWYYQEEETEISDVRTAFAYLEADSFTKEQPAGKEEIGLTVYLDNENHPQIDIKLYRYDGELCLTVVDGEPVSLVSRSAVVDLIEGVYGIVLN